MIPPTQAPGTIEKARDMAAHNSTTGANKAVKMDDVVLITNNKSLTASHRSRMAARMAQ